MKRALVLLLVGLLALLAWLASDGPSRESAAPQREPASSTFERAARELEAPEPASAAPEAAPALERAERVEIAPAAAPNEPRLTLLGAVQDRRGRAIEHFGIRGIRKDAKNVFAEERVWDVAFHAGGEFALEDLEPHAWELAPFADGYTLVRSERFVRSNARPVVFRMKAEIEIAGIVLDSMDSPVAAATVRATERSEGLSLGDGARATAETTTDRGGRFRMSLDASIYSLRAARDGYVDSEEQVIEVDRLVAQRDIELRLADACSVRIVFDRRALGDSAPVGAMAAPLLGGRGPQPIALGAEESGVTIRGLAPGWHRIFLVAGSPPDTAHTAAVELQLGPTLELRFETRPSAPVAIYLRPPQPGAEAPDYRSDYEILPTLPDLNWLTLSRSASGGARDPAESLWSSTSEWNAPAPGSYVAFPRRRSRHHAASPVRFEAPHVGSFELELAPLEPDKLFRR